MTVSEIIKCAEYLKHDDPALYNHLLYFEADWRAMREALTDVRRRERAPWYNEDAQSRIYKLADSTLEALRLKP